MTVKYANDLSVLSNGEDSDGQEWSMGGLHHIVRRFADFVLRRSRRVRPMRYGGRDFTKPQLISEAVLPPDPGLYAIHVPSWLGTMKVLHFGASHNLHEELMIDGHVGFMHWLGRPEARRGVWVSYHVDPGLDHVGRHEEGARLNRHYFPHRTHSVDEHLANHRIHRTHGRRDTAATDFNEER